MKLESLQHLCYILYSNKDITEIIRSHYPETVYKKLTELFDNIKEFDSSEIMEQIEIRSSSMNKLKNNWNDELNSTWWHLIMSKFYLGIAHRSSEERKDNKKAGICRFKEYYDKRHWQVYDDFTNKLSEQVKNNELKTYEEACQFTSSYLYEYHRNHIL